jgi:hypothetical protein
MVSLIKIRQVFQKILNQTHEHNRDDGTANINSHTMKVRLKHRKIKQGQGMKFHMERADLFN